MGTRGWCPEITLLVAVLQFHFLFILQITKPLFVSMYQKDVGTHSGPESSPTCVHAVKEPDEKLHFITGFKWGYCALLYGHDKCVCSSVTCSSGWINFACVLLAKILSAVCWCLRMSPQWETLVGALLPKTSQTPEVWNTAQLFYLWALSDFNCSSAIRQKYGI